MPQSTGTLWFHEDGGGGHFGIQTKETDKMRGEVATTKSYALILFMAQHRDEFIEHDQNVKHAHTKRYKKFPSD